MREPGKSSSACSAKSAAGDNLLMAMGAMLEDAQPMVTAEGASSSYRRLLSRAVNMCSKIF
ncbi:hypothetical protein ACLK1S_15150 [Escherichia coli]